VRVLYVNHTACVSGGERSLLDLLDALGTRVQPVVATPDGEFAAKLRSLGVAVRTIPGTAGSLRPHPVHTPKTVGELAHAAWMVRRIARRDRVDLVHGNSIRAGIVATAAHLLGAPPAVVHVRDVLPDSPFTRLTRTVVGRGATAIVGNSAYTLERFVTPRTDAALAVTHSPVDLGRMRVASELDPARARAALGIPASAGPILGVVAQLTPWKAQDDAVRIAAGLRSTHPDVRLLLIGSPKFVSRSTRHDNRAFVDRLEALLDELDVRDRVMLLGERSDVPEVLRALDLLLVPSWEEPFGRAVVEGLAAGVPIAATSVGGPREVLRNGVDGLLLPPRRPQQWIDALAPLLADPARLEQMARQGRARATAFGSEVHAERVLALYRDVLAVSLKPHNSHPVHPPVPTWLPKGGPPGRL
jgi:L-malate glycosyltransferase